MDWQAVESTAAAMAVRVPCTSTASVPDSWNQAWNRPDMEDAVEAFAPYDRIQDEQPALRADLVSLMRTALALRLPAWVIANNRAEGSAPLTLVAVARMLLR